ncbi:MAG TPA: tRNA pseudouridine(13) synthase TruD, partial [Thermovirgaceae bacterium]|nr:tRNA pseudouridine(13) synthase TruD [Thermovirgaceae bacterium]
MKIKVNPEDFRVEEILSAPLSQDESPHRVYRLRKRNWNTVDALAEISRAGELPLKELRWCGRKDRAALTTQYFSTTSRKDLTFKSTNVSAEFAGFSDSELRPSSISGNRFSIAIRDLAEGELTNLS